MTISTWARTSHKLKQGFDRILDANVGNIANIDHLVGVNQRKHILDLAGVVREERKQLVHNHVRLRRDNTRKGKHGHASASECAAATSVNANMDQYLMIDIEHIKCAPCTLATSSRGRLSASLSLSLSLSEDESEEESEDEDDDESDEDEEDDGVSDFLRLCFLLCSCRQLGHVSV